MVVSVMFWAPSVPVARLTWTLTWMVTRRFGAAVAPVCTTDHARVMPASGVSVLLTGPVVKGWLRSCSIICRA